MPASSARASSGQRRRGYPRGEKPSSLKYEVRGYVEMAKSQDSMGGGKGWSGGAARDRDSSSDGAAGGERGENAGLDPQLWHACAGGMVQLPPVGAKVIYFPQGHGEQAATPPEFPKSIASCGTIPCRVVSVGYLADTETDEVFARIRLQPLPPEPAAHPQSDSSVESDGGSSSPPPEKCASFAKTLTQSDANNGGGFSVPRYCAETIFPPLDYGIDPPVQTVLAKDVHGERWKFRHIYRGTPRRHLLTTGWSTFVNQKKLVAGDAIVFLRSLSGELCVGVRRSMRGTGGSDSSTWSGGSSTAHQRPSRWELKGTESFSDLLGGDSAAGATSSGGSGGVSRGPNANAGPGIGVPGPSTTSSFARNRARVTAKSVVEAASLAARGQPFEVVYYPRASTAEFCVKAQSVKTALDHTWYAGTRFKMAFETEDSSRISWFMGTISAVQPADPLWPKSPWRVLQVSWDEPDLLLGVTRVSPWQVELVATLPMQLPPFSMSKKKFRTSQPSEINIASHGLMAVPMGTVPYTHISPWAHGLPIDEVPAGMQGARHDRVGQAVSEQFRPAKYHHVGFFTSDNFYQGARGGQVVESAVNPFPLQGRESSNLASVLHSFGQISQGDQAAAAGGVIVPASWNSPALAKTSQTFVLFGQPINPDSKSQPQVSGGSSSDGPTSRRQSKDESSRKRRESPSESSQPEPAPDRPVDYMGYSNEKFGDFKSSNSTSWVSNRSEMDKCGGRQGSSLGELFSHCKVFKEFDEVGRTVDLSKFASYDELYAQLASMFSLEVKLLNNMMIYKKGSGGSEKTVGLEPYRVFAQSARRVIIRAEQDDEKARS